MAKSMDNVDTSMQGFVARFDASLARHEERLTKHAAMSKPAAGTMGSFMGSWLSGLLPPLDLSGGFCGIFPRIAPWLDKMSTGIVSWIPSASQYLAVGHALVDAIAPVVGIICPAAAGSTTTTDTTSDQAPLGGQTPRPSGRT